ncbi:MAG TPA: hypothetical protein VNA20_07220 [Frankiaceae bacterium]|nr:hypothetical protein [Frankiaceae bacterium]
MRTRRALAAAAASFVVAGFAAPAAAEPPGPGGGRCRVYWQDPFFDHGIPGLPPVPGRPYVICDR